MKTIFRTSFLRDFKAVRDKQLLSRLKSVIEQVDKADSLASVSSVKQIKGQANHYRIRIGDYRLALVLQDDAVTFVPFLHRREIYRYFP